ncbi:hypothetical protein [Bacillus sp. FDAARGOS_235]|uniref:hypothetical protein n=1 Tax=Bacillus sp. FDAARGOS_235 TaxID=1839798 RepID=UPI00119D2301|nr:hypothetical protein [Bacillus sp. FDAARGOS_235]
MEELFRFMVIRPPEKPKDVTVIPLEQESVLQIALANAVNTESPFNAIRDATMAYTNSTGYIDDIKKLFYARQLRNIISNLKRERNPDIETAKSVLSSQLGNNLKAVASSPNWINDVSNLRDSILTIKCLRQEQNKDLDELVQCLRILTLIKRIAENDTKLDKKGEICEALNATLLVPKSIEKLSNPLSGQTHLFESMISSEYFNGRGMGFSNGMPTTHGNIHPVGVGDLLIVKQQLVRYEGRDVADIVNVLKGESKSTEHHRKRTTEDFFLKETENQREEERDNQSTERFEIGRETSESLKDSVKFEAGVKVTAQYGPAIEVEAHANFATDTAKDSSKKDSTKYSKEVVDKVVAKYSEKVKQQNSLKIVEEVEETNKHSFEAKDKHVIGVYQWVDKVYEAQVFNYGTRSMYDIMIPEPGAFFIEALKSNAQDLSKITEFSFNPSHLDETNYKKFAAMYGAKVSPPPEIKTTVSKTFSGGPAHTLEDGQFVAVAELPIPVGYKAVTGYAAIKASGYTDSSHSIFADGPYVFIGNKFFVKDSLSLNGERNSIPVGVMVRNTQLYEVGIEVECERTVNAWEKWRLDTYATIQQAYFQKLSEYEEKLSKLLIQKVTGIRGQNPEINKKLIADELKKAAISIITQQHFDVFNAIENGTNQLPQVNLLLSEMVGTYARFFEQAFEWENIQYVFYPYYWGRKDKWIDRLKFDDPDPLFVNFIKAGEARIVIPARPHFEGAIDHFMKTGEIWSGGKLPDITDNTYLPIVEEIKNQTGSPLNEKPWGETWEIRVPTSLVRVRPDDSLPVWEKKNGKWVPSN